MRIAFSELLRDYIHKKDIQVSAMAHQLSIDRANLYKIISGKRNPSSRTLAVRMSEYLSLTPSEHAEFMEAYRIAEIGAKVYYQRKSALHFLLNSFSYRPDTLLENAFEAPGAGNPPGSRGMDSLKGTTALFGTMQIHQALSRICSDELTHASSRIRIIAQPDWTYLMTLLQSLSHINSHLSIEHIICLNTGDEPHTRHDVLYNISIFEKVLPLFSCSCSYKPYFYYDNIDSHFTNLHLFSYVVITEKYVLTCSSDISHGILYNTPDILRLYIRFFNSHLQKTMPLFQHMHLDLLTYINIVQTNIGHTLECDPCLITLADAEMLQTVVKLPPALEPIFPGPDGKDKFLAVIQNHIAYFSKAIEDRKNLIGTFSDNGLKYFMETGRIINYPEELYDPVPVEMRKELLIRLCENCESFNKRLLKGELSRLPLDVTVITSVESGVVIFRDAKNLLTYFYINEKSLLSLLNDFISHLDDSGFLFTMEETKQYLKNMVDHYCITQS